MNKKLFRLPVLLTLVIALFSLPSSAQVNSYSPPLGTKTLYTPGMDTDAPAPEGYTPFFINYVGRHGARHATGTNELIRLDAFLQQADEAGALRPDGLRLQKMVRAILSVEQKYPSGDLTLIGQAEQYNIGKDMGMRYPTVVRQPDNCLLVASTPEVRTVQSAESFLKGLAPVSTCITRIPNDTIRLRFFSLSPTYKEFEKKGDWKKAQARLEATEGSQAVDAGILHRLFDSAWSVRLEGGTVTDFPKPEAFVQAVYSAAVIVPGLSEELRKAGFSSKDVDIFSLLTTAEANEICFVDAAKDFFVKGPGMDSVGIQVRVAAPLLADFIQSSDDWLAGGKSGADLRFAHAETIAPIAALMDCEGAATAVTDPAHYSDVWKSDRVIGYSANIQWVFYRRKLGQGDELVKILYNERPIHLPMATGQFPYYQWKDVRAYYLRKLHRLDADPGVDMYGYLKGLKP